MLSGAKMKVLVSACVLALLVGLVLSSRPVPKAPRAAEGWRDSIGAVPLRPAVLPLEPAVPAAPVAVPQKPADVITADSYLVENLDTGEVYFQKDTASVRPIASISKLFTAIVATKQMASTTMIRVATSSITGFDATNSPSTIRPGESFELSDLVRDMLLVSTNDAATAIADGYPGGRAAFVSAMDTAAASLGMAHTSFADPSGLSPGNVSTADDLSRLARYLYAQRPDIMEMTRTAEYDVATTSEHSAHSFHNIDPFIGDPHLVGGKTGRTDEAGETMLTVFRFSANGKDYPVAIIVLHSGLSERQVDSSILVGRVLSAIQAR